MLRQGAREPQAARTCLCSDFEHFGERRPTGTPSSFVRVKRNDETRENGCDESCRSLHRTGRRPASISLYRLRWAFLRIAEGLRATFEEGSSTERRVSSHSRRDISIERRPRRTPLISPSAPTLQTKGHTARRSGAWKLRVPSGRKTTVQRRTGRRLAPGSTESEQMSQTDSETRNRRPHFGQIADRLSSSIKTTPWS
jgi:hypothetical protein